MIQAKFYSFEKLAGEYEGEVLEVWPVPNDYYAPEEPNSTQEVLTIKFKFKNPKATKPENKEVEREFKFISPLLGTNGIFAQMVALLPASHENDGSGTVDIDEKSLIGLKAIFSIGERVAKNGKTYEDLKGCRSRDEVAPTAQATAKAPDDDLPF